MNKRDRLSRDLRDAFGPALEAAFKERFGIEVSKEWNILLTQCVTSRDDGKPLTKEQWLFIGTFELGYKAATDEALKP